MDKGTRPTCGLEKRRKGVTFYLTANCPAGKSLAREVKRRLLRDPEVRKALGLPRRP